MNRSKSSKPVSVLRPANKAKNKRKSTPAATCAKPAVGITTPILVNNSRLVHMRKEIDTLLAGCSQAESQVIHKYLADSLGADRMMLDAWAKCGRNDHDRTMDIRLNDAARRTVTPFGIACLLSYARAWVDAEEARQHAIMTPPAS